MIRFTREGLQFKPGQHISAGPAGDIHMREYSLYSSVQDDFLEILVKKIETGYVSGRLGELKPGDEIMVEGPFGRFILDESKYRQPLVFVATGTGISPFHCFVRSYPGLDYTLLHGIRKKQDHYEGEAYQSGKRVRCVSGEPGGDFQGRVTDYLRNHPVDPAGLAYLCGNCDMIYEAYDILSEQGLSRQNIFTEVYF